MKTESLHILLERSRKYLNRILTAVKIVRAAGFAGVAGGIVILIAGFFGWAGNFFTIWPLFILAGILGGFIWGKFGRLDLAAAARWLDEKQQNAEAFSAALICLSRNCTGLCDASIVGRAESIAVVNNSFPLPLGNLKKHILINAGLLLLVMIIVLIWPVMPARNMSPALAAKQIKRQVSGQKNISPSPVPISQQSMHQLAQQLFPQNAQLAAMAEKALKSGDVDLLTTLMKQAEQSLKSPGTNSSLGVQLEQKDLAQSLQTLQSYLDDLKTSDGENNGTNSSNRSKDVSNEIAGKNDSQKQPSGTDSKNNKNLGKRGSPKDLDSGFGLNPGQQTFGNRENYAPSKGANAPGTETGNQKNKWGDIKGRSGSQKMVIVKGKNTPVLEYVLPGKDATVPLSSILPDSRRAAETVLTRNGVPLEYNDFVGSYFRQLSQEMNSPEREGQK